MFFIINKQTISKYIEAVIKSNSHAEGFMIRQGQGGGFLREAISGRGGFVKSPNAATAFKQSKRIISHCATLAFNHGLEPCLYILVKENDGSTKLELVMLMIPEEDQAAG
ncbi:hypothetical protein [Psychrobacter sp. AOP31-A1-22]|uniref:hypothetical protein n=1 Tax=Psychrobacter sp. AOP31-A1-22 TaxID=3457696 RepID=UPI0040364836